MTCDPPTHGPSEPSASRRSLESTRTGRGSTGGDVAPESTDHLLERDTARALDEQRRRPSIAHESSDDLRRSIGILRVSDGETRVARALADHPCRGADRDDE